MNKAANTLLKIIFFYFQYKPFINRKTFISLILSTIAATGVIMYGYQAPKLLGLSNESALALLGFACATCSMLANIMLGTFSLLTMKENKNSKINKSILLTSLIGSVPYGFLCFFSYHDKLSAVVNVSLSIIVVLVNAGIGYTALKTVLKSLENCFAKKLFLKTSFSEQLARFIGIVVGLLVSTTMYLATCHGLLDLFGKFGLFEENKELLSYCFAVLSWIPVAALFANGNQNVAFEIYQACIKIKKTLSKISTGNIAYLTFCLLSGTAIYAMMHDAYDSSKMIPVIFKSESIRYFINHFGVYIALLSSAALNYFAINNLKVYFNKKG